MNDEKKINTLRPLQGAGRKLFVETYGCQMNVGDTEIVVAIMQQEGYVYTDKIEEADIIPVSYTHLDVYKRQQQTRQNNYQN